MSVEINGRPVGPIGYGLLGLGMKSNVTDEQADASMLAALDEGANYFNGADFYGNSERNSLTILRGFLDRHPEAADKIVLNVKSCVEHTPQGMVLDGSPAKVAEAFSRCEADLGPRKRIDEFELARVDAKVPYEESLAPVLEAVAAGRVGSVACSEVSAATLRKAAAVTKVSSVEVELSLWETGPLTNGIAEVCAELDIPILAYSPLGRGFLTGELKTPSDIPENDMRRMWPRFQPGNFEVNIKLVDQVRALADRKGCTVSQVAIAWLLALSRRPGMPRIIPIPGASSPEHVRQNCAARHVEMTEEDMKQIDDIMGQLEIAGDRYHPGGMDMLDKS